MTSPNFVILYVANPAASACFYSALFGKEAVEASPTFAMFALESGIMLGLWSRDTVAPPVAAMPGGAELAMVVPDKAGVDALYAEWRDRDLVMAQAPCELDFGYTFVALDPDGHRVRVFAPSGR